jgi:guanylate kinase
VEDALASGRDVLMDIDVQGAAAVRQLALAAPDSNIGRAYLDIFVKPPSIEALEQRLRGRGKDSDEVILKRLCNARREMDRSGEYRYTIVNDKLDEAYASLRSIIVSERCVCHERKMR